jgi:hypothetical protein
MEEKKIIDPFELAKDCLRSVEKFDSIIGDLDNLYTNFDNFSKREIKEELKANIGHLLSASFGLVNCIVKKYPELDPDRD